NPTTRALVEIPHPLHDTHTWRIGGSVFNDSNPTGLLMAGAHRHANGHNTADVAHLDASIFQTVHETWTALDTGLVAFSIHGFDIDTHGAFPPGTDFVISNGTGDVSGEVIALDAAFDNAGYTSYV